MTELERDSLTARLPSLTAREREVLDLAIDGLTDEQMGQSLDISTSTVNSYWVRIRAKLGHMSRTELVGAVLRHESGLRYASLLAECERLEELEAEMRAELAHERRRATSAPAAPLLSLALDHLPDAVLVLGPTGAVAHANLQAEYEYAAEPGGLVGLALGELATPHCREAAEKVACEVLDLSGPLRLVLGVERPHYSLRLDGTNFRAVLVLERFVGPSGVCATVAAREYMGDVEAIVRALRQPYSVA